MTQPRKWIVLGSLLCVAALAAPQASPAQEESAPAVARPAVEVLRKANGDVFLRRDMPDVRERFGLDEASTPEESHESPLWYESLRRPHPSVATLRKYFREAERRSGVPAELLMAIGRVESNWTQFGPTVDQGWGVMHLVKNNYADTLGRAARLLGVSEQALKDDARLNILGAAAVMADAAGRPARHFKRPEDWAEAAKTVSGLIDETTRRVQAENYFRILRTGATSSTLWGEKVVLAAHPGLDLTSIAAPAQDGVRQITAASTDYAPAATDLTTCNYDAGRQGTAIDTWVNHWIASGTAAGAVSWFKNCGAQASAHFVIASNGAITQVVRVANTAWHAGNYPVNLRSIGVEHEVIAANPDGWYNMTLITASTDMARYFAGVYGIARAHRNPGMRGHKEIIATECPGGTMPWGVWMNKLNGGPGGCFCSGGISWWGKSIPRGDAYCGMRVCGGYNSTPQLFECQAGGWVSTGTFNCNCKCTGGFDKYGDPIDPDTTYCGKQVCGMDRHVYECRSGGWLSLGGSC
jgi:hypothetical protein